MKNRKSLYAVIAAAGLTFAIMSGPASAQISEEFGYAAGALISTGNPPWTAHSVGGTNDEQVVAGDIAFAGLTTAGNNKVTFTTSGADINRGTFSITGTGANETAFLSAVINITSAQATGDYFFHPADGAIGLNQFRGRLFARSSGAGYQLGISYGNNAGSLVYDTTVRTFSVPVFVVMKLTSVSGTLNDTAALFINPPFDTTEVTPTITTTQVAAETGQDWANIDLVCIRQGSAANAAAGQIDSIRVGANWFNVTSSNASSTTPVSLSGFSIE